MLEKEILALGGLEMTVFSETDSALNPRQHPSHGPPSVFADRDEGYTCRVNGDPTGSGKAKGCENLGSGVG